MKRLILLAAMPLCTSFALFGQIYTPNEHVGATINNPQNNIGIGTNEPSGKLEVRSTGFSPQSTLRIQNVQSEGPGIGGGTFLYEPDFALEVKRESPSGLPGFPGDNSTTFTIAPNGRTSIGAFPVAAPDMLAVLGSTGIFHSVNNYMRLRVTSGLGPELIWSNGNNRNLSFKNDNTGNVSLRINQHGKIAAGSSSFDGDHTFRVKGSTVSETLQVQAEADWAGNSNTVGLSNANGRHLFWNSTDGLMQFRSGNTNPLSLHADGKVGINTDYMPGNHSLYVKGTSIAEENILLLQNDWGDFVFEPDYALMPLPELQNYLATHKHLPDFPSADEVAEHGLHVGETQRLLTIKVEELTLYILQMSKEMEALREEITTLKGEK